MKRYLRNLIALVYFLNATVAFAADKTAYIRTTCANNGNGTSSSCAGSPGGAGAWNSCANAITGEVAANANLTTLGGNLILDAAGTTAETTQCVIDGFSGMDGSHVLRLRGDWVGGVWSTSYYRFDFDNSNPIIDVRDPYVEIDKVQVYNSHTGSGNNESIAATQGNGGLSLKVTNSLLRGSTGSGGDSGCIFFRPDVANTRGTFVNNVCYGYTNANSTGFKLYGSGYNDGEIIIAYNNTCHGSPQCFRTHGGGNSDAVYLKNNVAQSCSTCYNLDEAAGHTTNVTANNLSEDTSSPNNTLDSKVVSFVSETGGSEDLHLASGDTAAKDAGADLSADAQFPVSTDFEGTARPQGSAYDVGADELISSGTANHAVIILKGIGAL